jgi:hypothetical protein
MSGPLAQPGPLGWMMQEIQARVQQGFPPKYFDFEIMPQKADREWFNRSLKRTAFVALGWNGTKAEGKGGVFGGEASFTLALITRNPVISARYMGDALAPGLFAMVRVATLLLNGFDIEPAGTDWTPSSSIVVNGIGNLYNEDWGRSDIAVAALDLSMVYEEMLPPGLEQSPSGSLSLNLGWNFGGETVLTANIGGA